jgi:hypothetical protein
MRRGLKAIESFNRAVIQCIGIAAVDDKSRLAN